MADIFDMLISVLCPTSESARICTDFVQKSSHQVLEPIGPLFYFLLFPTVFIILFIYFLSDFAIGEHPGLRLLVSISVYIFIIISGWYAIVLPISEFWFIATIIFVGIWVFLKKLFGKGESTGKMEGLKGNIIDRIKEGTPLVGKQSRIAERQIKDAIHEIREAKKMAESIKEGTAERPGDDARAVNAAKTQAQTVINKYEFVTLAEISGKVKELRKEYDELVKIG